MEFIFIVCTVDIFVLLKARTKSKCVIKLLVVYGPFMPTSIKKWKILKTNSAIWYNKIYKSEQLMPKYTA